MVEDYELPDAARLHIVQTAPHFMSDAFPDPWSFDIDRYAPPRNEHLGPGYAPFGLGTHTCLGSRWMELQMAVNLLLLANHFTIEVMPEGPRPKVNPFPSMSLSKKMKFHISERRREIPV